MPCSPDEWAMFDGLPKAAREAIANSSSGINPYYIVYRLANGYVGDLAQLVRETDREETRKLALQHYDKDHPEAQ